MVKRLDMSSIPFSFGTQLTSLSIKDYTLVYITLQILLTNEIKCASTLY